MKMKRYMTIPLLLTVLIILAGCGAPQGTADNSEQATSTSAVEKTVPVSVVTLEPGSFTEFGEYYGKLKGVEEASLVTMLGGRVGKINVTVGEEVQAGSSLAQIDADKAQILYNLAILNEKVSKDNYNRQAQFLKDGNASQLTVDQMELAWLTSKKDLYDAKRSLDSALAVTPINGVVVSKYIDLYQETSPGTPTFTVANIDKMKVSVGIPEREIAGVKVGNEAEITLSQYPGKVWQGKIASISKEVSSMTLTFDAEILIDNSDGLLLPGTTAKVKLFRQALENQIIVPSESILSSANDTYVMIEENGIVKRFPVITGPSNKSHTVILEGLEAGQNLIIQGNHMVTDGIKVTVSQRS